MKTLDLTSTWLRSGTGLALALAACGAWAQNSATQTSSTQSTGAQSSETQEKKAEPAQDPKREDEPEEEEPAAPAIKWNELTIGYWETPDDRHFRRYGRPPEGFTIQSLRLFSPFTEETPYGFLVHRGQPYRDLYTAAALAANNGRTWFNAQRGSFSSFEFGWLPVGPNTFEFTEATLDQSLATHWGMFFAYRALDVSNDHPAPRDTDETRSEMLAAGIGGSALGGNLEARVVSHRIQDRTGVTPTTLQRRYEASYAKDVTSRLSVEGQLGYSRIEQQGLAESSVRNYLAAGSLDLGPASTLQFSFGRQDYALPVVQNAVIRKRLVSSARLLQRFPGWSMQFGFKRKEVERVRADRSYIDVPKVNEYDARIAGRLGPARLTLRGSWEDLISTAGVNTDDPRQLLWDDRATFQAKLDGGNEALALYTVYTYQFQQNQQRDVEINSASISAGGSYVLNPTLSAFAEFAYEDFRAKGNFAPGLSLDSFFPNGQYATVGVNWAPSSNLTTSAGLNYFESGDIKGTQATFTVRRILAKDHELGIVLAPWRQTDRLYGISGYRETIFSAQYTVRF